jgi:hypothetical protein
MTVQWITSAQDTCAPILRNFVSENRCCLQIALFHPDPPPWNPPNLRAPRAKGSLRVGQIVWERERRNSWLRWFLTGRPLQGFFGLDLQAPRPDSLSLRALELNFLPCMCSLRILYAGLLPAEALGILRVAGCGRDARPVIAEPKSESASPLAHVVVHDSWLGGCAGRDESPLRFRSVGWNPRIGVLPVQVLEILECRN